jgi:spore coat protein U-like protein
MLKKLALAAVAVALGAVAAHAATATGTFTVTATIAPTCAINSLPAYTFGTIGGTASLFQNFTSNTVQLTCSTGVGYAITLASANPAGGGGTGFNMINGTTKLGYRMYPNSFGNPQWDATVGGTYSAAGTGAIQTINLFGDIPVQTPPVGGWPAVVYTDTVTMTVTY